jgi:hypothetical protein
MVQRDLLRGLLLQGLDASSCSSTRGQKYGPQQVKMVMQCVANYTSQVLKLQDKAIGKRRIKESRSQQVQEHAGDCRRADSDSVSVRGEKQGNGRRKWSQGLCGVYGCLSATPIVIGVE